MTSRRSNSPGHPLMHWNHALYAMADALSIARRRESGRMPRMPVARALLLVVALLTAGAAALGAESPAKYAGAGDELTPLALSVVSAPTPFRGSDGLTHLTYELQAINTRPQRVGLIALEVRDAGDGRVLLSLGGA